MDYVMEGATETARLEGKTFERETRSQLELVGLGPGMTVLDAGCGSGAVSRIMAEIVGPEGLVVGIDGSLPRLRDGDLLAAGTCSPPRFGCAALDRLPVRSCFDLVWSRFVLEYQSRPEQHLAELLRAVGPDGRLVVGDVDDHGLRHHPEPPLVTAGLERVARALAGRFDPRMGRRLYHLVHSLGARDINVHLLPYHVYAGRAPDHALENWSTKFDVIRPVVADSFECERDYDEFVAAFIAMLLDESVFTYSTLVLVECRPPLDEGGAPVGRGRSDG